jgi:hypothetical protein
MSRRSASLVAAFLLIGALPIAAQEVDVDLSACRGAYAIVKAMRDGAPREDIETQLDALLETRPYRVMFTHYNRSWRPDHLPKDVFKRMILSLRFADAYKAGENERAGTMRGRWMTYYENPSLFETKLVQLEAASLRTLIHDGVRRAQSWLPPGWKIPKFYFVVIPNGGSPAFTIDDAQGYDFFQLPEDGDKIDIRQLVGTIAHESHHLGMQAEAPESLTPAELIAFRVMNLAVAEGAATKFVSGAPAGCVPAIAGVPSSALTPELTKSWNAHLANTAELLQHQITQLDRALAGDLSDETFNADLREYWLSGSIGRAYVLGAEIFGAIHFAFGKEEVFAGMKDPRKLFALYNEALDARPKELARCVRVPEKAVRQALIIGTRDRPLTKTMK